MDPCRLHDHEIYWVLSLSLADMQAFAWYLYAQSQLFDPGLYFQNKILNVNVFGSITRLVVTRKENC
jgi:hypothetical protein